MVAFPPGEGRASLVKYPTLGKSQRKHIPAPSPDFVQPFPRQLSSRAAHPDGRAFGLTVLLRPADRFPGAAVLAQQSRNCSEQPCSFPVLCEYLHVKNEKQAFTVWESQVTPLD